MNKTLASQISHEQDCLNEGVSMFGLNLFNLESDFRHLEKHHAKAEIIEVIEKLSQVQVHLGLLSELSKQLETHYLKIKQLMLQPTENEAVSEL
ncbi:MAG: hypothetical protein MUE85_12215 [Microscillaceae bacterium]|jgi:hypothetical protein|nr:hypothetical protein [Microscillaceae bacterium]